MSGTSDAPPLSPEQRGAVQVVIAAYNEAATIAQVVAEVAQLYPHVIVVDDGSADATLSRACGAGATVLRHAINRGQGAALQTGIRYALEQGAGYIVTFDADGQHDPRDIAALVAPIVAGEADVCLGSRFIAHGHAVPLGRRLLLRGALWFTRLTSGLRLTDTHNGLRALSRSAATHIDLKLDRMAHASEIIDQIHHSQLRHREVPVHIRYTTYSLAKGQHGGAAFRVVLDYLVGRVLR